MTPPVQFSVARGFFNAPFNLILAVDAPEAVIRYTLDHTPPTQTGGLVYTGRSASIAPPPFARPRTGRTACPRPSPRTPTFTAWLRGSDPCPRSRW